MAKCSFGRSRMEGGAIAPSTDHFRPFVMAMTEGSIAFVTAMTSPLLSLVATTESLSSGLLLLLVNN